MKYSFMTFSTPQLSLGHVLGVAKAYGYDGVEVRIEADHAHGVEVTTTRGEREAIKGQFASAGIRLACIATSVELANPKGTTVMLGKAREAISLAGDLGAPTIRVFGGGIPQGLSREDAISVVASSLREVAEEAADRGVAICFETHDDWTDPEHVAAVMMAADHPAVAVNWDVLHPVRTGKATVEESFEALAPWIRHLHIHDNVGQGLTPVPIGDGDIDHRLTLHLLKTIGYGGFLSGEWIGWEPYEVHLPRELKAMQGYEAELA